MFLLERDICKAQVRMEEAPSGMILALTPTVEYQWCGVFADMCEGASIQINAVCERYDRG